MRERLFNGGLSSPLLSLSPSLYHTLSLSLTARLIGGVSADTVEISLSTCSSGDPKSLHGQQLILGTACILLAVRRRGP
jgi:hypothetical protein